MIIFSDAGNTQNPALLVLAEMGYRVHVTYDPQLVDVPAWIAARGERRLEASSPVSLLGLALLASDSSNH